MRTHESEEDYLETLLVLERKNGSVRAIDVVNALGFSKPSVSVAMKKLREAGLTAVTADGAIALTSEGRTRAERVYERHTILTDWLTGLGVDPFVAAEDACRIEHVISDETFETIKQTLAT